MNPETFYFVKGMIALVCTVITVIHMNLSWDEFDRDASGVRVGISQRLRYISWFLFVVLIASASYEQIRDGAAINPRNVGAMAVITFAVITAIVSLVEARNRKTHSH